MIRTDKHRVLLKIGIYMLYWLSFKVEIFNEVLLVHKSKTLYIFSQLFFRSINNSSAK